MSTAVGVTKSIGINGDMKRQAISYEFGLPVSVVFTSTNRTLIALEKASQLAKPLKSWIEILIVQTVPFVLPLDDAPVPFEFLARRLEEMAARFPVQIKISGYLCRDQLEALKRVLNRNHPVLMGVRKRWWPTRDERVARRLQREGYNVILVETE
jgi:hypothetical protein